MKIPHQQLIISEKYFQDNHYLVFIFKKNYYFCLEIHHSKFQLICLVILTLKMI